MRRFKLMRDVDATGVSGTGDVAEGIQFTHGAVVVNFYGANKQFITTTVHKDIESVEGVHLHAGLTRLVWVDGPDRSITEVLNNSYINQGLQQLQALEDLRFIAGRDPNFKQQLRQILDELDRPQHPGDTR